MKSKTGLIIAAIVAVLLLGIGGFVYATSLLSKTTQTNLPVTGASPTAKAGMFSSIGDALSKNLTLQCDVKTPTGETVSYVKNGMIRVNITGKTPDQNGAVIMRDGKMYFWNSKTGIMTTFDMKSMMGAAPSTTPQVSPAAGQNPQDYIAMMEKYRESCKSAAVSDDVFVIPTNIKFQDMSQMMKLVPSAGSNGAVPSINPSAYQQMMQRYQNQTQP